MRKILKTMPTEGQAQISFSSRAFKIFGGFGWTTVVRTTGKSSKRQVKGGSIKPKPTKSHSLSKDEIHSFWPYAVHIFMVISSNSSSCWSTNFRLIKATIVANNGTFDITPITYLSTKADLSKGMVWEGHATPKHQYAAFLVQLTSLFPEHTPPY